MAINFDDPNVLMNQGVRIPVDTPSEYDAVIRAVSQIFNARPGGTFDADAFSQTENRIRGGQTIDEIVANSYDDAKRRFPDRDMVNNERDTALDIGRDAQLGQGRQFSPTPTQTADIYRAAQVLPGEITAGSMPSRQLATTVTPHSTLATQYVRSPTNAGPAGAIYGSHPAPMQASAGSGMNVGTMLLFGGVALVGFVLLRKLL
jgi:hypothetical protein